MNFGDRINKIRVEKGMTQDELAKAVGYKTRSAIAKIESGERDAPQTMIVALAKALGVTPSYLMGWEEESAPPQPNGQALDQSSIYMIPIYETVSAGFGAYADDHVTGYEPVYLSNEREARETLAITVRGDSMYPKIEEGDLVVVHQQDYFDNGDIVVAVVLGTEDGFVKRAFRSGDRLSLESINPSYPPMTFSGARIDDVRIMGVVRKIIKTV